jgi:MerR family copper efflux transcriptional regulator
MKIKELSSRTGLSVHTIRFYEKERLLDERHVKRTGNNYREYSDEAIERLYLIRKFKGIDCTLAELKDILHDRDNNVRSNDEVIAWIQKKIIDVEAKKDEYEQMLNTLSKMLKQRTSQTNGANNRHKS